MSRLGKRNKNRKRLIDHDGYVEVFEPSHPMAKANGYVREHRMIAHDAGLLNDPTMEVHHRNGNKTDNRLENLEVITGEEHTRRHWTGAKRKPWTPERRQAVSERMKGNTNWRGNIYENPDLLTPNPNE